MIILELKSLPLDGAQQNVKFPLLTFPAVVTNWCNSLLSIYNRKVLCVCLSRKMSTLPNGLKSTSTSTSRSVFMVFQCSRLGCHGSRSVFMVFHGTRLVFHDFSWFQVGFSWFFMVCHGFFMVFHGFS